MEEDCILLSLRVILFCLFISLFILWLIVVKDKHLATNVLKLH